MQCPLKQLDLLRSLAVMVLVLMTNAPSASAQGLMRDLPRNGTKGFTEPYRSIDLAAAEMGTLSDILVKEGEQVRAEQILGNLNQEVLSASRDIIIESIKARGKLEASLAELAVQQETLAKVEGLFQRKHASQVELDRARGQMNVAAARVQAVRDELRIKELELKRIDAQLEQRRFRSPIDGVVTRVLKDEGEFVSSADPVVFKVVQLDPLLVVFSLPPSEAKRLVKGQEVTVAIGIGKQEAIGVVEVVSPVAEAQSGTYRVRIRVSNEDQRWRSGVPCYFVPSLAYDAPASSEGERQVKQKFEEKKLDLSESIAN